MDRRARLKPLLGIALGDIAYSAADTRCLFSDLWKSQFHSRNSDGDDWSTAVTIAFQYGTRIHIMKGYTLLDNNNGLL